MYTARRNNRLLISKLHLPLRWRTHSHTQRRRIVFAYLDKWLFCSSRVIIHGELLKKKTKKQKILYVSLLCTHSVFRGWTATESICSRNQGMKSIISPVYSSAAVEQRTYSMRKKKAKTLFGKKKYIIDNKGQNESIFCSARNQQTIKRYRRFLELFLITA